MTISRNQLRAARMLLCLSQDELAALADVGIATIRRFETGRDVGLPEIEVLKATVEAAGAILLGAADVSGRTIGDGVALLSEADLPLATRKRMHERTLAPGESRSSGRPRKPRPEPPASGMKRKRRPRKPLADGTPKLDQE